MLLTECGIDRDRLLGVFSPNRVSTLLSSMVPLLLGPPEPISAGLIVNTSTGPKMVRVYDVLWFFKKKQKKKLFTAM